ncbi:Retrovirus-related Pol polyprotein from transposon RE2 [Vitis vinifera]|uniref:Retrovirus-related Pol polyprotein from transposon RE2 n=1 Tax=Vitis vinifera TaxID=29760 RepID=A0A438K080_VITVI|nr:Retrovirus-related Pol polyprotein from transposon RE2 [Vitis vinifera]
MNDEFDAFVRNGTWELVPSTSMQNLVGCTNTNIIQRYIDLLSQRFSSRILASCPTFTTLRFLPLHLVCCLLKGATSLIFLLGQKCLVQNLLHTTCYKWKSHTSFRLGWQQRRLYLYECLYCLFSRHPISWSSKKQRTVARSSTEVEYRSVASTTLEINWICFLLIELGVTLPTPPVIYYDNVCATYL